MKNKITFSVATWVRSSLLTWAKPGLVPLPEGERATPARGKGQPKADKDVQLQKVVHGIEAKKMFQCDE